MTKLTFQICFSLTILMSIFSCFGKKKENLESWLNKKFPGQYEILDSRRQFLEMNPSVAFLKKVTSVVSLKNDSEVQFVIVWYRNQPELGVTVEEIKNATEKSKNEVTQARGLYQSLTKDDSTHISVSVVDDAAYFLVFAEPAIENRKKYLTLILSLLDHRTDPAQTKIWIEFMEDTAYHKEFRDIVPSGYWNRIDLYHQSNKTVSLEFTWSPGMNTDTLMSKWTVNTLADRIHQYQAEAYEAASRWAEKNIKSPYYIEPVQLVWNDLDELEPMSIHFHFPYFPAKPAENNEDPEANRIGFISGIYQVDKKTFTKIEKGTEF